MKTIIKSTISGLAAMGMLASSASAACTNDAWNKVMSRGKIVVGVKADYKPWGYRITDGDIVGMEIDMANDVAAKWALISNWWRYNPRTGCSFLSRAKSI